MNSLQKAIDKLNKGSVMVIGDVMLDKYIYGAVDRISPEAPIPILRIQSSKEMLGGAGNVVANISRLGAKTCIVSLIGNDKSGDKINELLQDFSIPGYLIRHDSTSTVTKTRFVSNNQQILRVDEEPELVVENGEVEAQLIELVKSMIHDFKSVILSDYKKGVLSRTVCQEIISIAGKNNIPVFVDPKGNDYSKYKGATLIKPNSKELRDVFQQNITGKEEEFARKLLMSHQITYCLVTQGKDGMTLVGEKYHHAFAATRREVYDVSGAGDTVIATLAVIVSAGGTIEDGCFLANRAAGIVVTKAGTSFVTPFELKQDVDSKNKVFATVDLKTQLELWRESRLKIGFTNGCFDIIHGGHINTLSFAKAHCDRLIVGLNSDASIKRLKGNGRPINDESQRSVVMGGMENVDAVVVFDEDTPEQIINLIRPDVLIKGGDYKREEIVGFDLLQSYGGTVVIAPFVKELSTSNIISKMQGA